MEKNSRPCEAPKHVRTCSGIGETVDHFTPKCIARKLGWDDKQIDSVENLQYLSPQCHQSKDRSTPRKLQQVRAQIEGEDIKFGEHI